ncbi:MAG: AraC family transcriptional regulator ligand-binding domain-containing protein [Marinomonas sp.]
MKSITRVSIHWIKAILASAKSLGIETEVILSKAQIALDLDNNQPEYLSLQQTQKIWYQAEQLSGHEHFGLIMGQAFRPSYFHVVAYLAMTSSNLKEAYQHFIKFLPLITEAASLSLHYQGNQICIVFTPQIEQTPFSRHQHESALTLLLTFTRWLVGDVSLVPNKVMFEHDITSNISAYKDVFKLEPEFNQKQTCIYFPITLLDKELIDSDASLNQLHLSHAQTLLASHQNRNWRDKTQLVFSQFNGLDLSKKAVADHLNISPRTLQRRLQEEGCSFQSLLDEHKREQAIHFIRHTDLAFKVIALQLGFAEPSTFYRAINRWFNKTPQALRQESKKQGFSER